MEDLDLVERLSQVAPLRSLNCALLTSAERWQKRSVLVRAWRNARLRWLWRQGRSTSSCCGSTGAEGSDQLAYQKAQRWPWGSRSQP